MLFGPHFISRKLEAQSERFSDLLKVTELGSGSARTETQASLTLEASVNHGVPAADLILSSPHQ